jgi:A/G-specific adenine glycosylase
MIAEFMLHRTKADQIVPVYKEFIKKYPDVSTLATAKVSEIKKYTQSLGLHWRHKHFIDSAKFILSSYNGNFPYEYNELRKIPGIGEYISCAISIIAFKKPAPAIDSNIARFFNRIYGLNLTGEIRRNKEIKKIAQSFFKTKNCHLLFFGLIDFCSIICKPLNPLCEKCVINKYCIHYSKFTK